MGSFPSFLRNHKKKSSEREPLLPSYRDDPTGLEPPEPLFYKIAEFLNALQKGKLPSQDQLNIILQNILKSSLLRDDSHVVPRYGSLSQSGERVLDDVREMVEALLQIGMEKNGGPINPHPPALLKPTMFCSGQQAPRLDLPMFQGQRSSDVHQGRCSY
jgi:hypothetical protein